MFNHLKGIFTIADKKTKVVAKNALISFFIKGFNVFANFLTIPLVLSFLNTTQYGIWLTLTAILSWFSIFDLGFGNGLRNYLTIAIANENYEEGRIYVSTTYAALTVVFGGLIIIFTLVYPFINWTSVFNSPKSLTSDLNKAVLFSVLFLFLQFIVKLINTIFLAFQRSSMADVSNGIIQLFIVVGLYVLKLLHYNSLTAMSIMYASIPILVFTVLNIYYFNGTFVSIKPSFTHIKLDSVNKLMKIGVSFFLIQIAGLVLYATDNFIIAQLFHPSDVTTYNISYKYFSIINVIFSIFLVPFWSMTTQSFAKGDLIWIKKSIKRLINIWVILIVTSLFQLFASGFFFKIWTGNKVIVPIELSFVLFIYINSLNFGQIFANFLNGVGKVKLQLYLAVASMILNIPLTIFFVKFFHLGIIGIPLATLFTVIIGNVITGIQCRKIISSHAKGIWNS